MKKLLIAIWLLASPVVWGYTYVHSNGGSIGSGQSAGDVTITRTGPTSFSYSSYGIRNTTGAIMPNYWGKTGITSYNGSGGSVTFDTSVGTHGATASGGTFTCAVGSWILVVTRTWETSPGGDVKDTGVWYQNTAEENKFTAKYTNDKPYAVTLKVMDGATVLGTVTVAPNSTWTGTFENLTNGADGLAVLVQDPYQFTDGQWVDSGALITKSTTSIPLLAYIPEATPTTPDNTVTIPTPSNQPSAPAVTSTSGTPVWRSGGTGLGATDALTNTVYREGVDKQLEHLKKIRENSDAEKEEKEELIADNPTAEDMASAGAAAKATTEAIFAAVPTSPGYSLGSGSAPTLSITNPFGGGTYNFNPFTGDRMGTIASWFRQAMAWLTIITLAAWVWMQMKDWVQGFSTVPQAKGNTVAAGTGGQATALAAAGLMTVAIVAGLTALVGWTFGEITIPALLASVTTNPMSSMPTGVYWMVDQLFPVATMITALGARATFNMYGSTLFAGCAAVVRFIVP